MHRIFVGYKLYKYMYIYIYITLLGRCLLLKACSDTASVCFWIFQMEFVFMVGQEGRLCKLDWWLILSCMIQNKVVFSSTVDFFRGKKSLRHILYKYKRGTSKEHQVSQCAGLLTSVINKQHRGWLLVTRYPVKVADDCGMMLFCIFTQTIRYWTYLCLYILSSMHLNNTSGQFIINH